MSVTSKLSTDSLCKFDSALPAPTVLEAIGGVQLYPIPAVGVCPRTFTLEVKYPDMDDAHEIIVTVAGEGLDDVTLSPQWGDSVKGYVHFPLTEDIIGPRVDSDVYITYSVISGQLSMTSLTLKLTIQRLLDKDLPLPFMPQAKENVLDLREIRRPVRVHIGALPYGEVGMCIWLDIEGLDIDSKPILHHVIQGRPLTAEEVVSGVTEVIDRDFLHQFKDYSDLTYICYMNYKGNPDKNRATELRRYTYQIRQIEQLRLETEDFEAAPAQLVTAGGRIICNSLTIDLLPNSNGEAGIGGFRTAPGLRYGNSIVLCKDIHTDIDQQQMLITFANPLTRLKFAITWVHFHLLCELFDEQDNLIDDLELRGWSNLWADFSSAAGIKSMRVHASDYSFLDFFSMWIKP